MFSALAVCTVDCAIEIVLITLHYITFGVKRHAVRSVHGWAAEAYDQLYSPSGRQNTTKRIQENKQ